MADFIVELTEPAAFVVTIEGGQGPAGPPGPPGSGGDKTYEHTQSVASDTWTINHALNKYPSVVVIDSGGSTVLGDITYPTLNQVVLQFSAPFSGVVHLN